MQKLCCVAVSAAALLWVSALPSAAATITWVGESGTGLTSQQETTVKAGGVVQTGGALTYATDWMEFFITDALGGTATVDELADGFSGESTKYQRRPVERRLPAADRFLQPTLLLSSL